MNLLNQINTETPLWKRVWISLVVVFAIGFGIFIVTDSGIAETWRLIFAYLVCMLIFAVLSFVLIRLVKWIKDGIGEIKLGAFAKIILYQIFTLVLLVVFYFIASPYQNCLRQNLNKGFCIIETRW